MMKRTALAVALLATWVVGCGGEPGPSLVPVIGTVTINNKPLEGATIQFTPDASNKEARPATDTTGPEGNYKLMTRERSGAAPGKYRVSIIKSLVTATDPSGAFKDDPFMAELSAEGPPELRQKQGAKGGPPRKIEASFDREVAPEGGVYDFDVKASATAAGGATKPAG